MWGLFVDLGLSFVDLGRSSVYLGPRFVDLVRGFVDLGRGLPVGGAYNLTFVRFKLEYARRRRIQLVVSRI